MSHPTDRTPGARIDEEQRFRSSLIASVFVHALGLAAILLGPMLLPTEVVVPDVVPVRVLQLPSTPPPAPAENEPAEEDPAEEEVEEEPEPEPVPEPVTSEPEPIPRDIEDIRREREAEEERRREEEERRRREAEEERKRREAEERARREEEERAQPQRASRRRPTTQSARRQGIDITGTEESQTRFTIEDFPFAAYLQRIRDMVGGAWNPRDRGAYARELRVEVFFRIGRDGRLVVEPRVLTGSSDTLYDREAMRAVASAAPFPPLPREYAGGSLGVRFAFIQE